MVRQLEGDAAVTTDDVSEIGEEVSFWSQTSEERFKLSYETWITVSFYGETFLLTYNQWALASPLSRYSELP